jgi:uncharacterized 2Fe-2S/4Fe-4S cluster protein (DUF4445 family)
LKEAHVLFLPSGTVATVALGANLKDVMHKEGLYGDFPCGGRGVCGKCRVRITAGAGRPTEKEVSLLTQEEMASGVRLACLTIINGNITVDLQSEKNDNHQILLSSLDRSAYLQPHITKHFIEMDKPAMTDSRADWRRVKDKLLAEGLISEDVTAPLPVLRALPDVLRSGNFSVTAVCGQNELLGLEAGDTQARLLGMAFDIGTTTIVGYLLELNTGHERAVVSMLNPQTRFGGDVISRITHATQKDEGLEELHAEVTGALNQLIGEAVEKAGASRDDVYAVTVVGNTCMHHLFLGITPRQVALAPYVSAVSDAVVVEPAAVRLEINPAGKVFVLPVIAGFVGADTVAVLLATEMDTSEKIKLVIDIGTNGEIALGSKNGLVTCSAAAGPAFEGAQISCGMRGATGAIDHVSFDEELDYSVIGGENPLGLCGSALLDTVAGLLETGILDKSGRFNEPDKIKNPAGQKFKKHIIRHNNAWAFLLADGPDGKQVFISQKDIRELQLAKGAIAAGIRILMKTRGVTIEEIDEVLLAGAFGNYLNPQSACAIGLIPRELDGKIKMVGNAAGAGAKLALLSVGEYNRAVKLARITEFVELGSDRDFSVIFAESLYFKG